MRLELASGEKIEVSPEVLILAGYTGRDQETVRVHIRELEEQGVNPPASVPAYFVLSADQLRQEEVLRTPSMRSSGEAEFALFVQGERTYVTIASDHTDRTVEQIDVQLAKQCCPKIVGRGAWRLEDVEGRWDQLVLRSWTGDMAMDLYQEAPLAALLSPRRLLEILPWRRRPTSFCVFGGTTKAIGGLRVATRFRAELADPATGQTLRLEYRTEWLRPLEFVGESQQRVGSHRVASPGSALPASSPALGRRP